jgi:polyphenol oxidase
MWLKSDNITCCHGFSDRLGGVSKGPFESLNLGGSEDKPENISENRERALANLNLSKYRLSLLKQVHGANVCKGNSEKQEGDALVTNEKHLVLAVSVADCYPMLFHDATNDVIGAAHAGWRGTCAGIGMQTLEKMKNLGAVADQIQVAIGQGISKKNFEVGDEVIAQFKAKHFPADCFDGNHLDLARCNRHLLIQGGIPEKNIWIMNRCTFEPEFFSYRRDKGITGRMWGLIAL